MLRLFGALIALYALVGFMSQVPVLHMSAQAKPVADPSLDRLASTPSAPPERAAPEVVKDQKAEAGQSTNAAPNLITLWYDVPTRVRWAALCSTAALAIGVGILLYFSGRPLTQAPRILRLGPSFIFWLSMGYTGLLLIMAAAFSFSTPSAGTNVFLLNGILPIAVPWFGALGAVTISLQSVFHRNDQWNSKFNYWHIGRPLFGAVLGIVAYFIFVVIVTATGTPPAFLTNAKGEAHIKDFVIFYVVAFLVGYREETFRDLIKRATDLILRPGGASAPSPSVAFKDKTSGATIREVNLNSTNMSLTILVHNVGDVALVAPAMAIGVTAPAQAGTFQTAGDQVSGRDLAPGEARTVEVKFVPTSQGTFSGTLTVTGTNLATPGTIPIKGINP